MKIIMIRTDSLYPVRTFREAKTLSNNGHDVTILEWDRDVTLPENVMQDGYQIHRYKRKAPYGIKIFMHLPFFWFFEIAWLLSHDWDYVQSINFDSYVIALPLSMIKGKKVVYEIFDFYGELSPFKFLNSIISSLDRLIMKKAECAIISDDSRIEQIGRDSNKNIITIVNSPEDYFFMSDYSILACEIKQFDVFTIFFAGALQRGRYLNIDKVITAVKDISSVRLIIAGSGDLNEELMELSRGYTNIEFIGNIPYKEVIDYTLKSHLLFSLYNPMIQNNKYASSNKLFEALMCGRPIMVSEGTAMAGVVNKYHCGVIVKCHDVQEIKENILKIKDNPELFSTLGQNGRKAYETEYNWAIMENRLLSIYR